MRPSEAYLHEMIGRLESIQDPERRDAMDHAARWVAECIAADHVVHLFGSGHSALLAREVVGRAGGPQRAPAPQVPGARRGAVGLDVLALDGGPGNRIYR